MIEVSSSSSTTCAGFPVACDADTTTTRWFSAEVPYWINSDSAADNGDAMTQAEIIAAVQASYQAWDDVDGSILSFAYQGETTNRLAVECFTGGDCLSTTLWYNPALDSGICTGALGFPGFTLAITVLTENLSTGEILEADVIFDSVETWAWDTSCVALDVQTTLTHEYGHAIGIHHTELAPGALATRPVMDAGYFCDAGVASGRTLEEDDRNAARCLYPELPTEVLIDQTGSMSIGSRMPDAQDAAKDFVALYADNVITVSKFADAFDRPGYELAQDWTDTVGLLDAAIDSTSPGGGTPLWESVCCAIGSAAEFAPSNLVVLTDTEENASDAVCGPDCPSGFCTCTDFDAASETAEEEDVALYVVDITFYDGGFDSDAGGEGEPPRRLRATDVERWLSTKRPFPRHARGGQVPEPCCNIQAGNQDGLDLFELALDSGGEYCRADDPEELQEAFGCIQTRMQRDSKERAFPPTCFPTPHAADDVQRYDGNGDPSSPFDGKRVTIEGELTVERGSFDFSAQYVEDCSGGIQFTDGSGPAGQLGDRVRVTGIVSDIFGEIRLSPVDSVEIVDSGQPPTPTVTLDPSWVGDLETVGQRLTVRGFVVAPPDNFRFSLGEAPESSNLDTVVFVDPDTGIDLSRIEEGQFLTVTGVLSRRLGQTELKPRRPEDIVDASLQLSVGRLIPGSVTPIVATGAQPGELVYFGGSLAAPAPGLGICPPLLGDLCLDLVSVFLLGTATADVDGLAQLDLAVPAGVGGELSIQAAIARGNGGDLSIKSNYTTTPIVGDDVDGVTSRLSNERYPGDDWSWQYRTTNLTAGTTTVVLQTQLERPDGSTEPMEGPLELVLSPDETIVFERTLDLAGAPEGDHRVEVEVSDPDSGVLIDEGSARVRVVPAPLGGGADGGFLDGDPTESSDRGPTVDVNVNGLLTQGEVWRFTYSLTNPAELTQVVLAEVQLTPPSGAPFLVAGPITYSLDPGEEREVKSLSYVLPTNAELGQYVGVTRVLDLDGNLLHESSLVRFRVVAP